LLLSGIAGGLVGWIIWRICGRTCNKITIACALMFAAAVPLFSTLILVVQYQHFLPKSPGHFALRVLIAIVISVAFAFLTTTQIHWGEEK